MPIRSSRNRNSVPALNSAQQQFLSTLKWLVLVILAVTGSITWKLISNDSLRDGSASYMLDLPRELCGTVVGTGAALLQSKGSNVTLTEQSTTTTTVATDSTLSRDISSCEMEYRRVTANRTKGLTDVDFEHSRALIGSRYRLANLAKKLQARQNPVNAVFCGGSITIGHGVLE